MARTVDRTEERERKIVALNGLQVLFAQVIFQSIRDDGDSGVADKVVHFRMNAMRQKHSTPCAASHYHHQQKPANFKFLFLSKQSANTHSHTLENFILPILSNLERNRNKIKKLNTIRSNCKTSREPLKTLISKRKQSEWKQNVFFSHLNKNLCM